MRVVASVALVAAVLVAMPARADVLCRTKSGRVFARTQCKKRETRIELPKGPTGDAGAATTIRPVRILDAAGLEVGLIAAPYTFDNNFAVFEVGAQVVSLRTAKSRFKPDDTGFLHLAADCSDQRLVREGRPAPLVRQGIVVAGAAYYAGDPTELRTPVAREFPPEDACFGGSVLPNGNCCLAGTYGEDYFGPATVAFEISSLGLTPPFHLEP
jgi:hypothetical protein